MKPRGDSFSSVPFNGRSLSCSQQVDVYSCPSFVWINGLSGAIALFWAALILSRCSALVLSECSHPKKNCVRWFDQNACECWIRSLIPLVAHRLCQWLCPSGWWWCSRYPSFSRLSTWGPFIKRLLFALFLCQLCFPTPVVDFPWSPLRHKKCLPSPPWDMHFIRNGVALTDIHQKKRGERRPMRKSVCYHYHIHLFVRGLYSVALFRYRIQLYLIRSSSTSP